MESISENALGTKRRTLYPDKDWEGTSQWLLRVSSKFSTPTDDLLRFSGNMILPR